MKATRHSITQLMSKDQNDLKNGKREKTDYPERNDKLIACFLKSQGMSEKNDGMISSEC